MDYLKVKWIHQSQDDPVWLYSELDSARMETRKVYLWADGRIAFADATTPDNAATQLSYVPIPPLSEIASDPEFDPTAISQQEFEAAWAMSATHH